MTVTPSNHAPICDAHAPGPRSRVPGWRVSGPGISGQHRPTLRVPGQRVSNRPSRPRVHRRRVLAGGRGVQTLVLATVALAAAPLGLAAQDYQLLGTVELTSRTGHYKDSPVVLSPLQDKWETGGAMRIGAQHRLTLDGAELFVDHAIGAYPTDTVDTALTSELVGGGTASSEATGSAGAGDSASATVALDHDLYQGYASIYPAPWFTLRAGRQRMNWGTAYTFSVTDGLHPQNPDAEVETGFDGVSVALRPTPDISLELATAIQNAVATGDTDDLRYAVYADAYLSPVELGFTFVYQKRTTLRPGIVGSLPVGPVMLVAEGAMESYDPRGEVMDYQPLWSVGGEYTWSGDLVDLSLMTEYLYNGLAGNYPETVFGDIPVTSDYAGGFARRGYRYLAGGASLNVLESWGTSHQLLVNLSDESYLVSHTLSMFRIPAVDLEAVVNWNSGEAGTEFGDLDQDFIVEFKTTVHF
ncbi:MAG: hypothetical protein PF508_07865 [Spirochaeta sp.]|jgi:hypothetical protein|nr:hypothetical protein [Spirochaeta sp.]